MYTLLVGLHPFPRSHLTANRAKLTLSVQLFVGANIGLALSQNVGALIAFRFLQAAGSSSTISIGRTLPSPNATEDDEGRLADYILGAGVIADIAPAEERGGFIGTFAGSE